MLTKSPSKSNFANVVLSNFVHNFRKCVQVQHGIVQIRFVSSKFVENIYLYGSWGVNFLGGFEKSMPFPLIAVASTGRPFQQPLGGNYPEYFASQEGGILRAFLDN